MAALDVVCAIVVPESSPDDVDRSRTSGAVPLLLLRTLPVRLMNDSFDFLTGSVTVRQ